jgi:hypothetical protein
MTPVSEPRTHFACIIDFSHHHYSLGDALTSQVTAACMAEERGCNAVDVLLLLNPERPSARWQAFITPGNYPAHLENLLPAYLCLPQLGTLSLIRDETRAGQTLWRAPRWPSRTDHLRQHIEWPLNHDAVNAFHRKFGRIPRLAAPKGYDEWAQRFLAGHLAGKFVVALNPRQGRLGSIPAMIYRDSPLDEWHRFIDMVGAAHPQVHFLMLGGYHEWHRTLLARDNVTIPRSLGLSLAHELALLAHADLFIGTSSGFATMATFAGVPYLITNIQPLFAPYVGLEPGDRHYPFASEDQVLSWRTEDAESLLAHLEAVYAHA